MKAAIPVILLSFLFCFQSVAQSTVLNTRQKWKLLTNGNEAERVEAAKELHDYYQFESLDSLRMVGEILFFYGIDNHYQPAIEFGKITLSSFYIMTGRINDGIVMAKSTLQALQERGDLELLSQVCRIIASGYRKLEDGNSSMLWVKKAIAYTENNPDPKNPTAGMISLAEAYLLKNKESEAIATYKTFISKAIQLKNYHGLSSAYSRLGDIYRISQKLDLAEKFFRLSAEAAEKTHLKSPKAHALNNLAIVYFEQGDTSRARRYFLDALTIREAINDVKSISESYYNLGDYHFYLNQYGQALSWYEKSARFAQEHQLLQEEKDGLLAMARVHKANQSFDEATVCLEKAIRILSDLKLKQNSTDEELTNLQYEVWKTDFEQTNIRKINEESSFWFYLLLIISGGLLITVVLLAVKLNRLKKE
ncbi:tetratricopeptide repeat protein [Fluviicola sp.]|uniref:tetratricopeptide repeat protein n=1 Tax=Fluviicola sp. TaxID=1917219 RepID=UPI0026311FB8|nr:tetratricopeptide repeat protein [Fluviicola sp.]